MKEKIIIGISSSVISDENGEFAKYPRIYVNKDYVDAILKNGAIPVILPINQDSDIISAQIEMIDGLILSGGHDVFPHNYMEEPQQKLGEVFPDRDEYDFLLLKEAKKRKIPILGICRGLQLINVFEGGTLYQDLSYIKSNYEILKHSQDYGPTIKTHSIEIKENTILYDIFKEKNIMVNSFHHQVIKDLAKDYIVSANAKDGVIEAIENVKYPFLLGVQWHPEMLFHKHDDMNLIFKKLIENAKILKNNRLGKYEK